MGVRLRGKRIRHGLNLRIGLFASRTVKIEGLPSAVTRINVSIAGRGGVQGFES